MLLQGEFTLWALQPDLWQLLPHYVRAYGYETRLMEPKEAKDTCPALNVDGIKV